MSFQLINHLIWFNQFRIFSTKLKKHKYIWNKIEETTFEDIYFYVSIFIFKENHVLLKEDSLLEKIVTVEEELQPWT